MMRGDTLTATTRKHPVAILTLASLVMGGLSVLSAELGLSMGYHPLLAMAVYDGLILGLVMGGLYYFGALNTLWQWHISTRGIIYALLWLLPVGYAVWLNPALVHQHDMMGVGRIFLSTANQEFFFRGFVVLVLIHILLPKNYPPAYIILVGAVLSALPQIYMLPTPAPLVYVLYQIIWATLYAMVAVYAMLLWRNIGVIIALHGITRLYAGFDAPVLGVPAMYVSLLWFSILALIGRILCKPHHMRVFLLNKGDTE